MGGRRGRNEGARNADLCASAWPHPRLAAREAEEEGALGPGRCSGCGAGLRVRGGAADAGRGCGVRGGAEVQVSPPDGQPTAARTTLLAIATGVSCMRLHSGWDASSPALETSSSGAVTAMEQRRRSPNEIQPAGCCGPSQAPGRLPFVRQRGGKDLVPTLPSSLLLSQARPPSWGPVT